MNLEANATCKLCKYFCEREFAAFFVSFLRKKDQYLSFRL